MSKNKVYLGDSVYADFQNELTAIVLTTENGFGPSNTIVLEEEVVAALQQYVRKICAMRSASDSPELGKFHPIGTALENLEAGAALEINFERGLIRRRRC